MGVLNSFANKEIKKGSQLSVKNKPSALDGTEFDGWLDWVQKQTYWDTKKYFENALERLSQKNIDGADITDFIKKLGAYQGNTFEGLRGQYTYNDCGIFISALLQRAYDEGEKSFVLDFSSTRGPFTFCGAYITADPSDKMKLTLFGALDHCTGKEAQGLEITIHDHFPWHALEHAQDCTIFFKDGAGSCCGARSQRCVAHIENGVTDYPFADGKNNIVHAYNCGEHSIKRLKHYVKKETGSKLIIH